MSIGYACLIVGEQGYDYRTIRLDHLTDSRLREVIEHNLLTLERMINYNVFHEIKMFRITSDLIPFGSSQANKLDWTEEFKSNFNRIGEIIKASKIRVSMHPGQYTVLNSPDQSVVDRAVDDLIYHTKVLNCLSVDSSAKIILHIGGIYGDKPLAMDRFVEQYQKLPEEIKSRLVIENDDRSYNIHDVLSISKRTGIPVVYDNLHNRLLPSEPIGDDLFWIQEASKTWRPVDGNQKIHYSEQNPEKKNGSHSDRIHMDEFLPLYEKLDNVDVMLEVKDKNLSAIKTIQCTRKDRLIKYLENEWALYKYTVLERNPSGYQKIRTLLKNKDSYPAVEFYRILDESLEKEPTVGTSLNALLHVFGYFKKQATENERNQFMEKTKRYQQGNESLKSVKRLLEKMAMKYNETYLQNSYYFSL